MFRKSIFVLLLLSLFLTVGVASAQEEPIRIGLLLDKSGWLTLYGIESENGFKLGLLYAAGIDPAEYDSVDAALADVMIAGRPVEVIVKDYGSENPANDADNATAMAREAIESDGVEILYGTPNSGAAVAVQALIAPDNYNVLWLAGPAATPDLTGRTFNVNTFRVCRNTIQDALTYATIADQFGQKYVTLAVDTAFGKGTAAAFEAALGAKGVEFPRETIYVPSDTTDFTPYLQQVLDSGADSVLMIWAGAGGATLYQQAAELGVGEQMNIVGGTNSNDVIVASPLPENSVGYIVYQYTLPKTEANDWLTEKHIAAFNDVPDLFTECAFASAQAIYQALEQTEGDTSPEALIPVLEGMTFEGPKGTYTIRPEDHQALAPMYVIRYLGIEDVDLGNGTTMKLPQYELVGEASAEDIAPPCLAPEDRSSDAVTCTPPPAQ
ncbi:MAG: substrate-binding domain-containing protein [Chloroflexi bacterium]|nr:substrate-binding domain-containing protein [Chloroflexota bacterium]